MPRVDQIASALLLLIATSGAEAVNLNTDGAGQIALLPYYTVNNSFITNLTITNTTRLYKAVKVRFHESRIGAEVMDLNIYLSPYDVWNATLRLNANTGLPNLITEDESCSYPEKALLHTGIDFSNSYDATTDEDLTEGYVEIIEMGVIADGPGPANDGNLYAEIDSAGSADGVINASSGDRAIVSGLRHDVNDMPADCSVVADAWSAGVSDGQINGFESGALSQNGVAQDSGGSAMPYADSMNAGLVEPSGGITVYSIMIRVSSGAAYVQQATHIDNYSTVAQHYRPDDAVNSQLPSLASGDVQRANMLSADGNTVKSIDVPLTEYDTGALFDIAPNPSIPMGSNPLPIALVLSTDAVSAPYFAEPSVNGETDIVLTFPMRKYGIFNGGTLTNDLDGTGSLAACAGALNDGVNDGDTTTLEALGAQVNDYPIDDDGSLCSNAGYTENAIPDINFDLFYYDYEEEASILDLNDPCEGYILCPIGEPAYAALERGVNVISVNHTDGASQSVLGTPAANVYEWTLYHGFEAGWVRIFVPNRYYDYETNPGIIAMTEMIGGIGAEAGEWTGMPVIGFSAMAAYLELSQLGEVVELHRSVNRSNQ